MYIQIDKKYKKLGKHFLFFVSEFDKCLRYKNLKCFIYFRMIYLKLLDD